MLRGVHTHICKSRKEDTCTCNLFNRRIRAIIMDVIIHHNQNMFFFRYEPIQITGNTYAYVYFGKTKNCTIIVILIQNENLLNFVE